MATSLQTVRRLTIESRTVGVDETTQKLGRLEQAQAGVAVSSERAARQAGAYEQALASQQRSIDLANQAYLQMARDRAALASSMQQQVAANDNVSRSFTVMGLEAAEVANHLRTVATAAYAFSPAFREVVNSMAAPALRGAGVALVAVAGGLVTATNLAGTGLVRLGSSAALASTSLTPVAGVITSAGLAMQAFNPSLAGVATTIFGRLMPALRLLGAVSFVANAVGLLTDAWRLGGEELERYRSIAERAAKVDLSTTYFQRLTKGAEDAKIPVDGLTAALVNLQKNSADQLGGSALANRLAASVKAGNFADNGGVDQFAQANTTQQKFEAIVSLINQAMTAGQRLAALDIAGTAFGPEAVENLRKDSEYFDKLQAAAAKVAEKNIVSPEDVGRALDLQNRYDAAVKILETRWHPVQDLLTQAGIEFRANWVATVEAIASGVEWAGKLVAKLADVPSWFQKKMDAGGQFIIDNFTTPESRAETNKTYGLVESAAETDLYAVAVAKLRAGLQDQAEQQRKVSEANTIAQKVQGDSSKTIGDQAKATKEQADAYDRAIESLTKHIARQEADAKAVGLGAGALEEYRARATLLNAAQVAGRPITAALTEEIEKQAKAAGAAGDALARMRVQSQIEFERKTAFLSPEDVQLAQQLRGIYGNDVPAALASSEAAALRFNAQLRDINDTVRDAAKGFASDLVRGLMAGKSGMDALRGAAQALSAKLADKALDNLFSGNFIMAGIQAIGAVVASIFGNSSKRRDEENKAAEEAEQRRVSYVERSYAATLYQDNRQTAMLALEHQFQVEREQESFKGGQQMMELLKAQNLEKEKLQAEWDKRELERQMSFQDRLFAATHANDNESDALALFDRQAQKERAKEIQDGGNFIVDLESALSAERGNIVKKFADEAAAAEQKVADDRVKAAEAAAQAIAAIAARSSGFQDRFFAATNDNTTVGGALAAFDRQAAQQRVAEVQAGGQAINDLEAALAAERLNIVNDFAAKAAAAEAEAAKVAADAAKAVLLASREQIDYQAAALAQLSTAQSEYSSAQNNLNSAYQEALKPLDDVIAKLTDFRSQFAKLKNDLLLNTSLSSLNPQAQYLEAQRQYRDTFALAQGGDQTALARLTTDLNTYLDKSRSYNASTQDYYRDFEETQVNLASIDDAMARQVTAAQQQINVLNQQVAGLITINSSVLTVGQAINNLTLAMKNVTNAQANVNTQRDFGPRAEVNKFIQRGLESAGLNFTGNYGPNGNFGQWVYSQSAADQAKIQAISNSVPQSLIDFYAAQGLYAGGGYTGAGNPSDVAGLVHKNEYVFDSAATNMWGPTNLAQMALGMVPANFNRGGGDNSDLVAEMRALRSELSEIKRNTGTTAAAVAATCEEMTERLDAGNRTAEDNSKLLKRLAA